jgi:hypothetical protein
MKRIFGFALAAVLFAAAPALAYVVKLKDGTIIFARTAYAVKGTKAIITLENGTVTQYDLDKIDVTGTTEYNERYKGGNVIGIDTPDQKVLATPQTTAVPPARLQDLIRQKKAQVKPAPTPGDSPNAADPGAPGQSGTTVENSVQVAFAKFFDGAGISGYRLTSYRGKLRLLSTANAEDAVFNALSAAARAVADLADKGRVLTLEIVLTTSGGETGGTFTLTPDQARALVNGQITAADYFVKNVAL